MNTHVQTGFYNYINYMYIVVTPINVSENIQKITTSLKYSKQKKCNGFLNHFTFEYNWSKFDKESEMS